MKVRLVYPGFNGGPIRGEAVADVRITPMLVIVEYAKVTRADGIRFAHLPGECRFYRKDGKRVGGWHSGWQLAEGVLSHINQMGFVS